VVLSPPEASRRAHTTERDVTPLSASKRWRRIFARGGRSVVVAMDHAGTDGIPAGLEDPRRVLEQVTDGGADAILTTVGVARHFADLLAGVGLILRCDGATSPLLERGRELVVGVETALALDADAIAAMYFPGIETGERSLTYLPLLAEQAHRWNLPLMAEALPRGFSDAPDRRSPATVAVAARMAVEAGADIVKTFYTGDVEGFSAVTAATYAPVLVLGGPRAEDVAQLLANVREALDAGAAGVVIGRQVWQAPDPAAVTRALVALVHGDASVAEALGFLPDRAVARAT
jgi:DhnA family fructose-bisphosphate aldolase class Ia